MFASRERFLSLQYIMTTGSPYIWLRDFFKVTRSYNLLIILVTQFFVYFFLIGNGFDHMDLLEIPSFFLLSAATIAIAAAGYIINDYHDIKIDLINKPSRVVVGNVIKRRIALLIYIALSLAGVLIGFLISWKIGAINIFSASILWLYSIRFKKMAFWGNLSIAVLTALSILIIYVWEPEAGGMLLLAYAWFAFIITLIREIIKDMEDMKGDQAYGCKTLPIVFGIPRTINFLVFLTLIMAFTVVAGMFVTGNIVLQLFAAIVLIELILLLIKLRRTDTVSGYRMLGKYCKVIMLTGIVAMLFF